MNTFNYNCDFKIAWYALVMAIQVFDTLDLKVSLKMNPQNDSVVRS